ncbi:hypothetical protein G3O06_10885 [Burkholderia sp. Ac-20345]|uniref:hypothetical protein n=1 Tax=Burkholderia sp. Ac-20345 TaxID=2703891 RepID=UPI00197B45EA|nr:hypothetical protein [Burkholderia sp. Ac-20345]MBN3778055.1 hypothetical protein [Burkholderia sp. Ac-20345]
MKTKEILYGFRLFTGSIRQDRETTMSDVSKQFRERLFQSIQHDSGRTGHIDFAAVGIAMPSRTRGFFRGFASEL